MKRNNTIHSLFAILSIAIIFMSYSGSAPQGYTGGGGEGTCASCHSGGSFGGSMQIAGLPSSIQASTSYPIVVTLTKSIGSPSRAGFTLRALNGANASVGTLSAGTSSSASGGYVGHAPAVNYSGGNTVTYAFSWTSPASTSNNAITFYSSGVIGNGSGTGGDEVVVATANGTFAGAPPPVVLGVIATNIQPVSCNGGSNGAATVSASGGSGCNYTYAWSNNQTGATATNLPTGTYTVTATCGASSGTTSVFVPQPSALSLNSVTSTPINCNGNGTASVNANGGTPNYTYLWSNGQATQSISVANSGTYFVTVTDSKGCSKTGSTQVSSNTSVPTAAIQSQNGSTVLNCNNTSLILTNSQNSANYLYKWANQSGGNVSTSSQYTINQANTYLLTVTDATSGCAAVNQISISQNTTVPTATISNMNPTITCASTSVVLDASSSVGSGLSYQWTGTGIVSGATTSKATVNQSGSFSVKVTDNTNGCFSAKNIQVSSNTTVPTLSASGGVITCSNPSVNLAATSSASTFSWTGPNNFTSTSQNPTVAAAGTYSVTATGANGCKATASASVTANSNPTVVSINGTTAFCQGASSVLSAESATTGLTYLWSTGETTKTISTNATSNFSVSTTASNGCKGFASVTTTFLPKPIVTLKEDTLTCIKNSVAINAVSNTNLSSSTWTGINNFNATILTPQVAAAGTYNLSATATNGCNAAFTVTIYENKNAPIISITGKKVFCQGDSSVLSASNGFAKYVWSNASQNNQIKVKQSGAYLVTVTGSNGCVSEAAANVVVSPTPNLSVTPTIKACEGANISFSANVSNVDPTTYVWSGVNNFSSTTKANTIAAIKPLVAGTYFVTATSAAACTATNSISILVSPKMSLLVTATSNCDSTVVFAKTITGGIAPFTLNFPVIKAPLSNYTATVIDSYACTATSVALDLAAPTPIVVAGTSVTSSNKNGKINLTVSGGAGNYSYEWSNGAKTKDLENLEVGEYCVTVTDKNTCSKKVCFMVKKTSSTEDNSVAQAIQLFPNPVTDVLQIAQNSPLAILQYILLDEKGRVVAKFEPTLTQIDMSVYPNGVYFLKIQTKNTMAMKRIMKM